MHSSAVTLKNINKILINKIKINIFGNHLEFGLKVSILFNKSKPTGFALGYKV